MSQRYVNEEYDDEYDDEGNIITPTGNKLSSGSSRGNSKSNQPSNQMTKDKSSIFYENPDVSVSEEDGHLAIRKGNKFYLMKGRRLLPASVKEKPVIVIIPKDVNNLKLNDVVIDPETDLPCFYIGQSDGVLKLKDIENNTTHERDVIESDDFDEHSINTLFSMNALFKQYPVLKNLAKTYGLNSVCNAVVGQIKGNKVVNEIDIECQINPSAGIGYIITALGNLKN